MSLHFEFYQKLLTQSSLKTKPKLVVTLIFHLFLCAVTCQSLPPGRITNTRWYHPVPEVIPALCCNQVTEAAVSVSLNHLSNFYTKCKCPIRLCVSVQISKATLTAQYQPDSFLFISSVPPAVCQPTTAGRKEKSSDFALFLLNQARLLTWKDSVS